ncbi:DUF6571 domain-containing protein [Actinomyces slackii]|uniref:DUF6571 domain-containing protein n=1 Tax=Actinomyces slackii TaxID=52774 RepID=A0A448KA82_9ACTO|nr:DUF6571 family protein [Actinomyces slackii]VEG73838.1 Uncharacterised protein [Actinomyces slackii]
MTYVYLDYAQMKTVVAELNNYAEAIEQSGAEIRRANENNNGAGDIDGIMSWGELVAELRDTSAEIDNRVETAKSLNENGITPTDGNLISYVVPEKTDDDADVVVRHANGLLDANELTKLAEKNEKPSEETWNELINRLQNNQNDGVYADAVLSYIGPEGMLDLPYRTMDMFGFKPGLATGDFRHRNPQAMHDLNNIFGHMLASASRNWGDEKSSAFANQLADAAQYNSRRMCNLNATLFTTDQKDGEATALDYNDAMLITLARRLEAFEDPEIDTPAHETRDFSTLPPELGYFKDPLPGVVRAMTANPSAALEWLAPSDPSKTPLTATSSSDMISRIEGLVNRCDFRYENWTEDWTSIADRISRGDAGHGPTIVPHSYEDTRNTAAVSGIMNGVGEHLEPWVFKDHLSDKTRSRIGDVLSRYPAGIDKSTEEGNGDGKLLNDLGYSSTQPILTDKALRNLIAGMGEHHGFGNSIQNHHDREIETALTNYDPDRRHKITVVINDISRTNGFIAGSDAWHNTEIGEAEDAKLQVDKAATSWLASHIPVIGGEAATVTEWVHDFFFKPNNKDESENLSYKLTDIARDSTKSRITLAILDSRSNPLTPEEMRLKEGDIEDLRADAVIRDHLYDENENLDISPEALRAEDAADVRMALDHASKKISIMPGFEEPLESYVVDRFDEGCEIVKKIK